MSVPMNSGERRQPLAGRRARGCRPCSRGESAAVAGAVPMPGPLRYSFMRRHTRSFPVLPKRSFPDPRSGLRFVHSDELGYRGRDEVG